LGELVFTPGIESSLAGNDLFLNGSSGFIPAAPWTGSCALSRLVGGCHQVSRAFRIDRSFDE
jgi:hypothetical protein